MSKLMIPLMTFISNIMFAKLEKGEDSVVNFDDHTLFEENSPRRFSLMQRILERQSETGIMDLEPRAAKQLIGAFLGVIRSFKDLEDNPTKPKTEISPNDLVELKEFAKSLDVDSIGFTEIEPIHVFQDKAVQHNKAIVLTMEMVWERISLAPSEETHFEVHRVYNQLGIAANKIADWLRKRGFSSHAVPPANGVVLFPPLAEKAGLGYRGLHGIIVTPENGSRVRLSIVSTNITNLPLSNGTEHAWIGEYCEKCKLCIEKCPVDAMVETPIKHNGGLITYVDQDICFPYFSDYQGCSVCIAVCPFSYQDYDLLKANWEKGITV